MVGRTLRCPPGSLSLLYTHDYVILHRKRGFTDVTKITNQLTLSLSKGRLPVGLNFSHEPFNNSTAGGRKGTEKFKAQEEFNMTLLV